MKILGRKSIVYRLETLLSFLLFLEIAAAFITGIFFIMAISSGDEGELMSAWPVAIYPPAESVYSTLSMNAQLIEPAFKINQGTIEFSSRQIGYYLLKAIDALTVFVFLIYITYLLRQICTTLAGNHPFTAENAKRLRIIALVILMIAPYKILRSALYMDFIKNNIAIKSGAWISWSGFFSSPTKGNVWLMPDIDMQALLVGLLLLIITEIFRIGTALQADKDSII